MKKKYQAGGITPIQVLPQPGLIQFNPQAGVLPLTSTEEFSRGVRDRMFLQAAEDKKAQVAEKLESSLVKLQDQFFGLDVDNENQRQRLASVAKQFGLSQDDATMLDFSDPYVVKDKMNAYRKALNSDEVQAVLGEVAGATQLHSLATKNLKDDIAGLDAFLDKYNEYQNYDGALPFDVARELRFTNYASPVDVDFIKPYRDTVYKFRGSLNTEQDFNDAKQLFNMNLAENPEAAIRQGYIKQDYDAAAIRQMPIVTDDMLTQKAIQARDTILELAVTEPEAEGQTNYLDEFFPGNSVQAAKGRAAAIAAGVNEYDRAEMAKFANAYYNTEDSDGDGDGSTGANPLFFPGNSETATHANEAVDFITNNTNMGIPDLVAAGVTKSTLINEVKSAKKEIESGENSQTYQDAGVSPAELTTAEINRWIQEGGSTPASARFWNTYRNNASLRGIDPENNLIKISSVNDLSINFPTSQSQGTDKLSDQGSALILGLTQVGGGAFNTPSLVITSGKENRGTHLAGDNIDIRTNPNLPGGRTGRSLVAYFASQDGAAELAKLGNAGYEAIWEFPTEEEAAAVGVRDGQRIGGVLIMVNPDATGEHLHLQAKQATVPLSQQSSPMVDTIDAETAEVQTPADAVQDTAQQLEQPSEAAQDTPMWEFGAKAREQFREEAIKLANPPKDTVPPPQQPQPTNIGNITPGTPIRD